MPVKRCQNCNYIIVDPSVPCSSCGSTYVEQPAQQPITTQAYNSAGAADFSVGVVLSRSFSTLLKHPFVFMGLATLSQLPGLVMMFILPVEIALIVNFGLSFILWLIIQGAIAYGVYEVLRGNAALLGQSLSLGLTRIVPLALGALSFTAAMALVILLGVAVLFILMLVGAAAGEEGALISAVIGVIVVGLPVPLIMAWLLCVWYVFVPACVVERLGPIKSLNRSAELTKGCRWKIVALYLLFFSIMGGLGFIGFMLVGVLSVLLAWFSPALFAFLIAFQPIIQVIISAPMVALAQVMIAVTYYELRSVKEGVSVDSLANVFD